MGVWRELAVWMHEGITIGMSDSHADYYVKNLVAILAEFAARRRRHGDGRVLRDQRPVSRKSEPSRSRRLPVRTTARARFGEPGPFVFPESGDARATLKVKRH